MLQMKRTMEELNGAQGHNDASSLMEHLNVCEECITKSEMEIIVAPPTSPIILITLAQHKVYRHVIIFPKEFNPP